MKKAGTLLLYVAFCFCLKAQISLGPTLSTFGVLAGTAVTNTGNSIVAGNVGVAPGSSITGFPPGSATGTIYSSALPSLGAVPATAQGELTIAILAASGLASNGPNPPDLGGTTVAPGVHTSPTTLGITGNVTLDGQGNPNSIFVFQIGTGLTTGASSSVTLINGASAANVYWQVGSAATLGATSSISGNILAGTAITSGNGVTLIGRALAKTAVTLIGDTVDSPGGPGAPPPLPSPPPPPPVPAPSSLILVATALLCAALYQARKWLLKPFRSN